MNEKEFNNSPTGHLVPTTIYLVPYKAFVPNELPPFVKPDWEITNRILEAQQKLSELKGLGSRIENPNLFIRPFIRREAVLSSMIEGTRTEIIDLLAYEVDQIPVPGLGGSDPPENDIREVLNYVAALEFGLSNINKKEINENYLCKLHKILLSGVRGSETNPGCFREVQNYIGKEKSPDKAAFFPPPVVEMRKSIKGLLKYINKGNEYPPIIRLALIHYQFEAIHPFIDGNGRIGRLLNTILLIKWNLLDSPLIYLSGFIEEHKEKYYRLLLNISKTGSWDDWLSFFLHAITEQSNDAIYRIVKLQDLKNNWLNRPEIGRATVNIIKLIDYLFANPYTTISDAEKLLKVTNKAARNNISKLLDANILMPATDKKYGQLFVASEVLKIIRTRNISELD